MGLGTKIKEALSGDHHDTPTTAASSNPTASTPTTHKTPGAFPSDDIPQKHTDGKDYTSPHGTALNNDAKWNETGRTHAGPLPGTALSPTGTQRNRLSKGTNEHDTSYDAESRSNPEHRTRDSTLNANTNANQASAANDHASNAAYWGDLSHSGHAAPTRDLPERTRLGQEATATSSHHHNHHLPSDQAVGGGFNNAAPTQRSHLGSTNRDPTEDSRFGNDSAATSGRQPGSTTAHRNHLDGPPVSGLHNSSVNSGNPEHFGSRTGQSTSAGHNVISSGTDYDHQDTGFRGDGLTTSQRDRTGHGHGLAGAGAGAAAGVGAATGYGAHEYGHNKQAHAGDAGSGRNASDGVPRSSMLDPEPGFNNSSKPPATGGQYSDNLSHNRTGVPHSGAGFTNASSPTSAYSGTTGNNDPGGVHGPHASRIANAANPRVDSDRDHRGAGPAAFNSTGHAAGQASGGPPNVDNHNAGSSLGFGSSTSPTQSASSGPGRNHFGPGHEEAKVLHSCQHCGRDNDISQYFSKDVVYRLGQ